MLHNEAGQIARTGLDLQEFPSVRARKIVHNGLGKIIRQVFRNRVARQQRASHRVVGPLAKLDHHVKAVLDNFIVGKDQDGHKEDTNDENARPGPRGLFPPQKGHPKQKDGHQPTKACVPS
mmetsp:Transcript_16590/g.37275  ORF Transcript_16590/g.37275 Transcript_16590/m.37275 type:complete len:121 (-) Transcript_16590:362-724(-)